MIITFTGHKNTICSDELREKISVAILENFVPEDTVFYCGGYGNFDNLCASVIRDIKKDFPELTLIFVTPYITEGYQERLRYIKEARLYDEILYPELEKVPYKFAISKRNEWMTKKADLVIAFVKNSWGGAYKTLEFAKRKGKKIINLAE